MQKKQKIKGHNISNGSAAAILSEENERGMIRIETDVISSIVRKTSLEVEGVTRISGNSIVDNIAEFVGSKRIKDRAIQISVEDNVITVDVSINVAYGVSLPEVAAEVQEAVSTGIEELTGISVKQVNVAIREMEDPDNAKEEKEAEE